MVVIDKDGYRFNYRVGAIVIKKSQMLLCHNAEGDYWYVPGGRVELGEDSRTALKRELQEELGQRVRVGRVLWMIENLFELQGRKFHEIGLYYSVDWPLEPLVGDFSGLENGQPITFRWFPLGQLPNLQPAFLKTAVRALPVRAKHVIFNEISAQTIGLA
ncbi:MAG: NUDIX hydrolase [Meiothermus sp.]|nr:NUDIX hydrolase [Meiothermus sp.]